MYSTEWQKRVYHIFIFFYGFSITLLRIKSTMLFVLKYPIPYVTLSFTKSLNVKFMALVAVLIEIHHV
jgi:hypothetical protein